MIKETNTMIKNTILQGNALDELKKIPDESIDCVITSPPYYLLREYSSSDTVFVWDEDPDCEHEWTDINCAENFCKKCGAWKGELGQEPTPELYIKHLADIFDEVKRVLKKSGNCFIIIGDTYAHGSKKNDFGKITYKEHKENIINIYQTRNKIIKQLYRNSNWIKPKQLLLIPYRLAIEMQERGWIIRDLIVWAKSVSILNKTGDEFENIGNGMPESALDRLTKGYEIIIHAVKSKQYYFNKPRTSSKIETIERKIRGISSTNKNANSNNLNKPKPNLMKITTSSNTENIENFIHKDTALPETTSFSSFSTENCSSKFLNKLDELSTRNGSYAGRILRNLAQGKEFTVVREAIVNVNLMLKNKLSEKGLSIKDIARMTGLKESTIAHYFRTDLTGAALPDRTSWELMRPILELPPYEEVIREEYRSVLAEICGTSFARNVIQANTEPLTESHFAPFPEKIVRFLLKIGCPPGGTVLDPFLGSGTTARVATELGMNWIGIEPVSEYVKIAEKRTKKIQMRLF